MTAREIFNQCVEEQLFGTCVNIEIKKHSNLAKAHPKGEIHYYRQAMWDIQQELSTHTLFNSWALVAMVECLEKTEQMQMCLTG